MATSGHDENSIVTVYGSIPRSETKRFMKIAGHEWNDKEHEWAILSDEIEYWHLVNPGSVSDSNKWKKQLGRLPVRDFNFGYAWFLCDKDVIKAMDYAEEKLFDAEGKPVYLPEELGRKAGIPSDQKPPGYSKILKNEEEAWRSREG